MQTNAVEYYSHCHCTSVTSTFVVLLHRGSSRLSTIQRVHPSNHNRLGQHVLVRCYTRYGQAACFGRNTFGQLGRGDTLHIGDEPGEMANLTAVDLGHDFELKAVHCGGWAASYRACSRAFVRSGSIPVNTRTLSAVRARVLSGGRTGRDLARVDGNRRLDAVDQLLEVADTRWLIGDHADIRLQANKNSLRKALAATTTARWRFRRRILTS